VDGNSKLTFAIIFRNPQSKAQTGALIWLISSVLFKRYSPTCLAWSHMTSQFVTSSGVFIRVLLSHPNITDLAFDDCDKVAEALTLVLASEKTKDSVAPNLSYLALLRCADVPPQLLVDLARAKDVGKRCFRKLRECIHTHQYIEVLSNHRCLIFEIGARKVRDPTHLVRPRGLILLYSVYSSFHPKLRPTKPK